MVACPRIPPHYNIPWDLHTIKHPCTQLSVQYKNTTATQHPLRLATQHHNYTDRGFSSDVSCLRISPQHSIPSDLPHNTPPHSHTAWYFSSDVSCLRIPPQHSIPLDLPNNPTTTQLRVYNQISAV